MMKRIRKALRRAKLSAKRRLAALVGGRPGRSWEPDPVAIAALVVQVLVVLAFCSLMAVAVVESF